VSRAARGGEPLRLALIGCGRIAQVAHLPAIEKVDDVELVGVADPSPALARGVAERYRVGRSTTDAAELFDADDVDAVLLAVPDRFHRPLAEAALRAGKHVLVEKPLASTTEDCAALVELVESTGLVLQVGAMKRHDPGVRFAHRWLRDRVGPVLSFSAWYRVSSLRPGLEATLFPPLIVDPAVRAREATFKADRARYLLATHGAHLFDSLDFLLGKLDRVQVQFANQGDDMAWAGLGTTRDGAVGSFDLTVDSHGPWSEGFTASGAGGSVHIESDFPFYRRASQVRAFSEADQSTTVPSFADTNAYVLQLRHFVRAVRGEVPPEPDVRAGSAAVALIEAVQQQVERSSGVELVG
jgi:predicted dehydrogenase